jgi:hypothetical protein
MKTAWKVEGWCSDYGTTQGIVFAESFEDAIEKGLHAGFNGETGDWDKKSEPWAMPKYNQYADLGYVPPKVLIADGWGFGCWECDSIVDSENEQEEPEGMDTEDGYYYPEPVFNGRQVFCCQQCADDWKAKKAKREAE